MKTFLGLGECMVELSPAGPGMWRQGFAGDVFNTLWYARQLLDDAWQVKFHTAVGTGPLSDDLVRFAEDAGVRCHDAPRVAGKEPGLYTIRLEDGERSFAYWRSDSAARYLMADPAAVEKTILEADLVFVTGITLAILPPDDVAALIALMDAARAAGRIVAFDPNARPRLWPDVATMREVTMRAAAAATIMLPSFEDEAATFGDASPWATAWRYGSLGCYHVVVKDGARPTLLAFNGGTRVVPVPFLVDATDTTAAGDSFNGAYLACFAQTGDPVAAVRAGHACASRVVAAPGALVAP